MYLRQVKFQDGYHFIIRESYRDGEGWKHKDVADLGTTPERYIEYTGGNGFYFSEELEERLQTAGLKYSSEDLEGLFLPFLNPRIRRIIESFQAHPAGRHRRETISPQELTRQHQLLHSFDKRRLHFLRCGRVDIGELDWRPWKFLNVLMEKSRDEIEHTIEGMERVLRPHEMRPYLFTALHLQRHFPDHLLRNHPAALDQETVDGYLLEALCAVNNDAMFFSGVDRGDRATLHPFLSRYLILYFDSDFERDEWPESLRQFMHRRHAYRRPPAVQRMDMEEACRVFGISREDVGKMKDGELVRMYRKKAKALHPDKGGDKESFIRMAEAFGCLVERAAASEAPLQRCRGPGNRDQLPCP